MDITMLATERDVPCESPVEVLLADCIVGEHERRVAA